MGEAESDDATALEQIKLVSSVVTFIIIAIGILGNVLSLVVLTRPNMKVRIIFLLEFNWPSPTNPPCIPIHDETPKPRKF